MWAATEYNLPQMRRILAVYVQIQFLPGVRAEHEENRWRKTGAPGKITK